MLIPSTRYSGQTDTPGATYPHGKARNAGSFQDGTGTPLEKDWINDLWGWMQALVGRAGITPSGDADTATASDLADAVEVIASELAVDEFAKRRIRLRHIAAQTPFAIGIDLAAGFISAASTRPQTVLCVKAGASSVLRVRDADDHADVAGDVASITSEVVGVARGAADRLVAVGSGGNFCCFSTNDGTSWSAGSSLGAAPNAIVYNTTFSRFMVTFAVAETVAQDVDGASTWAAVATGLTSAQAGIAVLSSGVTVVAGLDGSGDLDIARSTDGGATWSVAGGTVPNPSDYDQAGWVVGDEGDTVYHAGPCNSGTQIRICSSEDGLTWTLLATITAADAATSAGFVKLMLCPDTGLLVCWWRSSGSLFSGDVLIASTDGGVTWSEKTYITATDRDAIGVANGRIFNAYDEALYATDAFPA